MIEIRANRINKICTECHEKVNINATACTKCGNKSFLYNKTNSKLINFRIKHDINSIDKKWQYIQFTDKGTITIYAKSKTELKNKVLSNNLPWDDKKADNVRNKSLKKSNKEPDEKPKFKGYGQYYMKDYNQRSYVSFRW